MTPDLRERRRETMKKAIKIGLGVVGGLFVLVTGVGLTLPQSIQVERSIVINAPSDAIYPLIADFKNGWSQWSPFEGEDPEIRQTFSGPEIGVGASQSWESPKMGDGHMTMVKADPAKGVEYDLMLMHDSFRLNGHLDCEPATQGTKVTWVDHVEYGFNPYRRYMGVAVKGPLGKEFERGLESLKRQAEAKAASAPRAGR
jgi:hypothetical protein